MPIISRVGRRSFKVRFAYTLIFALLTLGAVSMIYPLMLMLSGSVKSQTDFADLTPLPRYVWNDEILWQKFVESKYANLREAEKAYRRHLSIWNRMSPDPVNEKWVDDFEQFRNETTFPSYWYLAGHAKNIREFRYDLQRRYESPEAYAHATGASYAAWAQVQPPVRATAYATRLWSFPTGVQYDLYNQFKDSRPRSEWIFVDPDAVFWSSYLIPQWPKIDSYNAAHGTKFASYRDVLLDTRIPASGHARDDWETFVRTSLNAAFIRIDQTPAVAAAWQKFLQERYVQSLPALNLAWGNSFTAWDQAKVPPDYATASPRQRSDMVAFIKDAKSCPADALSIYGPRQAFEEYIAKKRNTTVAAVAPLPLPTEAIDLRDFKRSTGSLRWEFLTANYRTVVDYLLLHGNAFRNTVIYCALAVITHLLVNPLAAYALSRYRPPAMYSILLFCMATMAFPHEVTMIPAFLLLKQFPVLPILIGGVAGVFGGWMLHRAKADMPMWTKLLFAAIVGFTVGKWVVPLIAWKVLGWQDANVSLLNSFWALVLPGLANGFSIFLLKGFFDSLPRELYEAAELDGAGEWTKFWNLTMALSKPILAVLALGAFTHAYSEFMMALVIIPDPKMWTIMVWLFQFQSTAQPAEVYASLVIAAIPTMLIFLFCQNLIMRGIVVPTEK
jgi:multiple sugar transport system permease protein